MKSRAKIIESSRIHFGAASGIITEYLRNGYWEAYRTARRSLSELGLSTKQRAIRGAIKNALQAIEPHWDDHKFYGFSLSIGNYPAF